MPPPSRLLVRLALVWLLVGVGMLMSSAAWPGERRLAVAGYHALAVGWLTQLVFGVALWLFPKARPAAGRWRVHGAWGVAALTNAGVALRTGAELALAPGTSWVAIAGGVQLGAALLFCALIRGRVRGTS